MPENEHEPELAEVGIRCPKCNCGHSWVIRTTPIPNGIRRRHVCRYCGRRFNSHAKIQPPKEEKPTDI